MEAVPVENSQLGLVAPYQTDFPHHFVQGLQNPESLGHLGRESRLSSPVRAKMRASVARFVAPQTFSAAFRIRPWVSISKVSACNSRTSLEDRLDAVRPGRHHTAGLLRYSQAVLDGRVDQLSPVVISRPACGGLRQDHIQR